MREGLGEMPQISEESESLSNKINKDGNFISESGDEIMTSQEQLLHQFSNENSGATEQQLGSVPTESYLR